MNSIQQIISKVFFPHVLIVNTSIFAKERLKTIGSLWRMANSLN